MLQNISSYKNLAQFQKPIQELTMVAHIVQHTYGCDVGWGKNIACKDKSGNIKSKTIIAISYKKIAVYFVLIIFSK